MNLEELQERLKQLEEAKANAIANANAIAGAIQECQYWIDKATPKEEIPKEGE